MRKMKDSGIPWLGDIPYDWNVYKIKNIAKRKTDKNMPDEQVLSLYRELGVVIKSDRDDNHNVTSDNTENYKFVEVDDIVVNKMKAWQGSIAVSAYQGIVSPAYYVYKIFMKTIYPWYMHYILRCVAYLPEYRRLSGGIRLGQWDLSDENFKNIPFPVPQNYDEQQRIADYLDSKCSKIDSIISKQEQIIEKLKEYKLSLITEAVTKGLDPNVEMKDSGIPWIGRININYSIQRMKYLLDCSLQYGALESGIEYEEHLPRYIRITDISSNGQLKADNKLSLTEEQAKGYILFNKDILFARSGGTVGKTFIYKDEYGKCAFAGYLIKARINKIKALPEFVYYYTLSSSYELWKNYIFIQATIQNIGADKYSNMVIPVPPLSEQKRIVEYLDLMSEKIDKSILDRNEIIQKMKEYKKSLIYEVVTGKKEV